MQPLLDIHVQPLSDDPGVLLVVLFQEYFICRNRFAVFLTSIILDNIELCEKMGKILQGGLSSRTNFQDEFVLLDQFQPKKNLAGQNC